MKSYLFLLVVFIAAVYSLPSKKREEKPQSAPHKTEVIEDNPNDADEDEAYGAVIGNPSDEENESRSMDDEFDTDMEEDNEEDEPEREYYEDSDTPLKELDNEDDVEAEEEEEPSEEDSSDTKKKGKKIAEATNVSPTEKGGMNSGKQGSMFKQAPSDDNKKHHKSNGQKKIAEAIEGKPPGIEKKDNHEKSDKGKKPKQDQLKDSRKTAIGGEFEDGSVEAMVARSHTYKRNNDYQDDPFNEDRVEEEANLSDMVAE